MMVTKEQAESALDRLTGHRPEEEQCADVYFLRSYIKQLEAENARLLARHGVYATRTDKEIE